VQVSAGVYGTSGAWVNNSSSSARQINKLLVEEVLALNKKSAYIERGTVYIQDGTLPFPYLRYYDNDNGRYYTALTWSWNAGEALLDLTLRNIGRNFEYITSDEQGGTRNPFLDNVVQNQATKPGNVMQGYNAEAEEIFNAWTSGTVIGAGKTLEAYYTVTLNGNGKYVNFQGNTPADPNDVIERVIYVKSLGLADHTSTSGWTSPAALQPTASTSAGPTIAECWQAINEYLTKFNGSQNNFTFLISYDEVFFEGLLDDYPGAAAAYSLRLLDKDYSGDAIRVRRASDNTEQDIGFDSYGDLDTSALATFCSGTDGFVKTWYDQANGNDATQTTTANQPKIYDSATGVVTENGRPAVLFSATTGSMSGYTPANGDISFHLVASCTNLSATNHAFGTQQWGLTSLGRWFIGCQHDFVFYTDPGTAYVSASVTQSQMFVGSAYQITGNKSIFANGVAGTTGTSAATSWTGTGLISNTFQSRGFQGTMSEMVIYETDQSTNRTGIETNINDYYDIY
jgi:hypothetical protein